MKALGNLDKFDAGSSIAVHFVDVFDNPCVCRPGVVMRCREFVLGHMPILDGNDDGIGTERQRPRCAVVNIDVGNNLAAAVIRHDDRGRTLAAGYVDAGGQCPDLGRNCDILGSDLRFGFG